MVLQKLTDSLLEMEEDRAIWSSKEKASLEAIEDKAKLYKETALLDMSEVRFIFTGVDLKSSPALFFKLSSIVSLLS